MIAARQIAFGKATGAKGISAKYYIQDGLIAMWDGIENAGWGVHDANATVWKNLISDNYHLPILSGVSVMADSLYTNTYGPVAALDGTQYGISPFSIKTIQIVFSWDKTFGDSRNCFELVMVSNLNKSDAVGLIATDNGFFSGVKSWSMLRIPLSSYEANSIASLTTTYQSGNTLNTSSFLLNNTPSTAGGTENRDCYGGIFIGGNIWNHTAPFYGISGNIYNVRLCSRALTAEEIAHNYEIDRARFNLS
jgi:hypothetical protein